MKSKQDDNNSDLQQTKENDYNSHTQSTNVWMCNKIGMQKCGERGPYWFIPLANWTYHNNTTSYSSLQKQFAN